MAHLETVGRGPHRGVHWEDLHLFVASRAFALIDLRVTASWRAGSAAMSYGPAIQRLRPVVAVEISPRKLTSRRTRIRPIGGVRDYLRVASRSGPARTATPTVRLSLLLASAGQQQPSSAGEAGARKRTKTHSFSCHGGDIINTQPD